MSAASPCANWDLRIQRSLRDFTDCLVVHQHINGGLSPSGRWAIKLILFSQPLFPLLGFWIIILVLSTPPRLHLESGYLEPGVGLVLQVSCSTWPIPLCILTTTIGSGMVMWPEAGPIRESYRTSVDCQGCSFLMGFEDEVWGFNSKNGGIVLLSRIHSTMSKTLWLWQLGGETIWHLSGGTFGLWKISLKDFWCG